MSFGLHISLLRAITKRVVAAYQGPAFHSGLARVLPHVETEIVRRSDQVKAMGQAPDYI